MRIEREREKETEREGKEKGVHLEIKNGKYEKGCSFLLILIQNSSNFNLMMYIRDDSMYANMRHRHHHRCLLVHRHNYC